MPRLDAVIVAGIFGAVLWGWKKAVELDKQEDDAVSQFIEEEKGSIAGMKRKSKETPPSVRARIEATVKRLDSRDHSRKGSGK